MPPRPTTRLWLQTLAYILASSLTTLAILTTLYHALSQAPVIRFDHTTQAAIHNLTSPHLTAVMLLFTRIGSVAIFAPAIAATVLLLFLRGRRHSPTVLALAMTGAFLLNEFLKLHFHRPRPVVPWSIGDEHTWSFPSGHSLFSAVFYGTLTWLALRRRPQPSPRRLSAILIPALLLPIGIGLSRIYLGMHWPTEVLAGWTTGLLWLAAVIAIDKIWNNSR